MLSRVLTNRESYSRTLHRNDAEAANDSAKVAANKAAADKKDENPDLAEILQDRYEKGGARANSATYSPSSIAKMLRDRYNNTGEPAKTTAYTAASAKSEFLSVKSDFWRP